MKYEEITNFINGKFEDKDSVKNSVDVLSPQDDSLLAKVQLSDKNDLLQMVNAIKPSAKNWGELAFKKRSEVFYNYRDLIKKT